MLTSPSREWRFKNSSDSNFSFWFGTTLGILKRNLGFGALSVCCGCGLWWWEVAWNISPWWGGGAGPGCWGGWPKGNMLKEDGAALCSIAMLGLRPRVHNTQYYTPTLGPHASIDWVAEKPQNFVTECGIMVRVVVGGVVGDHSGYDTVVRWGAQALIPMCGARPQLATVVRLRWVAAA